MARIPHSCDSDPGTIISDYFNAILQADLLAFVQTVATHVASSRYLDHFTYVCIGVGLASEGFYLMYNQIGFDRAKVRLVVLGYSPFVWKYWQESMMTAFQTLFPTVHLSTLW
jgi:hypothetical protein